MKPGTVDVLELLRNRGAAGVTSLDALASVGSFRLGARVWELRQAGYDVRSEMVTTPSGKRIARYTLHERTRLDRIGRAEFDAEMELGLV